MILLIHLFALAIVLIPAVAFGQDRSFTPLTSIPGLNDAGDSPDITTFLNQAYKICIGAAAGIAVLQIIRAGILFMTNKGSVSENEKARELLQGSVFGLILVLSPVIVFGIINPKILELNFSAERLESRTGTEGTGETTDTDGDGDVDVTDHAVSAVRREMDAGLAACNVAASDPEKSCLEREASEIRAQLMTCLGQAAAGSGSVTTCAAQTRTAGRAAGRECVPAITDSQLTCLEGQIMTRLQTIQN